MFCEHYILDLVCYYSHKGSLLDFGDCGDLLIQLQKH